MAEEMLAVPNARREARDVSARFIAVGFVTLVLGIAIVGLLCWWLFPRAPRNAFMAYPPAAFPTPHLQAAPSEDMARFYRQEMERLNSVGWVDRAKGIAHIPIEQAMRMIAKDGIKDWPKSPQAAPPAPPAQAPP